MSQPPRSMRVVARGVPGQHVATATARRAHRAPSSSGTVVVCSGSGGTEHRAVQPAHLRRRVDRPDLRPGRRAASSAAGAARTTAAKTQAQCARYAAASAAAIWAALSYARRSRISLTPVARQLVAELAVVGLLLVAGQRGVASRRPRPAASGRPGSGRPGSAYRRQRHPGVDLRPPRRREHRRQPVRRAGTPTRLTSAYVSPAVGGRTRAAARPARRGWTAGSRGPTGPRPRRPGPRRRPGSSARARGRPPRRR